MRVRVHKGATGLSPFNLSARARARYRASNNLPARRFAVNRNAVADNRDTRTFVQALDRADLNYCGKGIS